MPTQNTAPRQIAPTHPGEMLREDFLPDYGLTASTLAVALGVSRQTVHELLKCERAVTPLMALRLSRLFGNSPNSGSTHNRRGTSGSQSVPMPAN
jgi:addiction module HigA family antidote